MLSLSLTSLSTADDADASQQKFSWKKDTNNLTFVIDSYGARDNAQLIKVVQGTQVRHTIEIERLVAEGEQLVRQMQDHGVQMQVEQLPISAIVRCPLLAIRWQLPDQKIRRIQLKFKSDADFDTARNRLQQLGLHMTEQHRVSSPSRSTVQGLSAAIARAPSARPSVTAAALPERPSSGTITGGGLSCPPALLAEISSRPHTAANALEFGGCSAEKASPIRPSSAASAYSKGDGQTSSSFSGPLNPPVLFPRPHSATADILGRSSNLDFSSDQHMSAIEDGAQASTERPETAMLFNRPDTVETLPPRRELPFQRLSEPRSSGSDTVRNSDRPLTGLMGPPALPSRTATQRPSSSLSASSKDMDLPPLPQPTVIEKSSRGKQTIQQAPRTPNQDENAFTGAHVSPRSRTQNPPLFSSSSPVSSPLVFGKSSSTASASPRPLSTPNTMVRNSLEHIFQPHPSFATPPASNAIQQDSSAFSVGSSDAERLAAYTQQSDEGRRVALNEFIFRHLESEDFLTLVEDMETAWARVALGMR